LALDFYLTGLKPKICNCSDECDHANSPQRDFNNVSCTAPFVPLRTRKVERIKGVHLACVRIR